MTPLSSEAYQSEQEKTLNSPREKYGIPARILFTTMDLVYGKKATLSKFKVLEIVARVPYQAWENVAYIAMTHKYRSPKFARRVFEYLEEARHQQDNEQWHLLIIEELTQKWSLKEGTIKFKWIPQLLAFSYYFISWAMYVMNPKWSYRLNAEFEDHAEHEYMKFANQAKWLEEGYDGEFAKDYGRFSSLKNLWIQIGMDERQHKLESFERMKSPRFSLQAG